MVRIELDNTLVAVARLLAERRHDTFNHEGYETDKLPGRSYDRHLLGALAEVAVSDYYNILVDMDILYEGDEHDFRVEYEGDVSTIDVKTTTYQPPWLKVKEWKTDSDYFILTYLSGVDANSVKLIGWASQETVLDGDFVPSVGGGDFRNYQLWADELSPLPSTTSIEQIA